MRSNDEKQLQVSARDLLLKGYTVASAARAIGRTRQHVDAVLRGARVSAACIRELRALPPKAGKYSELLADK